MSIFGPSFKLNSPQAQGIHRSLIFAVPHDRLLIYKLRTLGHPDLQPSQNGSGRILPV